MTTYRPPVGERIPDMLKRLQDRVAALEHQTTAASGGYAAFACTSSTRPSSPFTGMEIYETDTGNMYVWSGSAWIAIIPQTPTGPWTTYTPTLTGTLGNGSLYGAYSKTARQVAVRVNFTMGSTTSISSILSLSLPFTAATVSGPPSAMPIWTGTVLVWTASGNNQAGWAYITTGGTTMSASSTAVGTGWTATTPQTWATNDKFGFSIAYESAT